MEEKKGRPRDYQFLNFDKPMTPALFADIFQELRARVEDQIEDLSVDELDHHFSEFRLSIRWLFLHLSWAEMNWLQRITGVEVPEDLRAFFNPGRLETYQDTRKSMEASPASECLRQSRRMADEYVVPIFGSSSIDFDAPVEGRPNFSYGRICSHLIWHWTYHSGQIGLMRLLLEKDYSWSFK